jgi:hypothetical protein
MNKIIVSKLLFLLFLGANLPEMQAQTPTKREPSVTRYIQDLYQYMSSKCNRGQYYENTRTLNQDKLKWYDDVKKLYSQSFYYSYVGEEAVLRIARVSQKTDKLEYDYEFAFDNDGVLILIIERQNDVNLHKFRTLKAYYHKEKCINIILDIEISPSNDEQHTEKLKNLQKKGKELREIFLLEMKEYQTYQE